MQVLFSISKNSAYLWHHFVYFLSYDKTIKIGYLILNFCQVCAPLLSCVCTSMTSLMPAISFNNFPFLQQTWYFCIIRTSVWNYCFLFKTFRQNWIELFLPILIRYLNMFIPVPRPFKFIRTFWHLTKFIPTIMVFEIPYLSSLHVFLCITVQSTLKSLLHNGQ